jgi:ribosomal RNA assembly protein
METAGLRTFLRNNMFLEKKGNLVSKTHFNIIYPKYQEKKIKESWKVIKKTLNSFFIFSKLDLFSGSISIVTTKFTKDPFCIIKARDFLKLISRSVPTEQAAKIFFDNIFCEVLKISNFTRNKKVFLKRRKRLIGINGSTIKAIEMVTNTYILVQGNTASVMGSCSGIKQVRTIIEDCMKNIHPVFHIKLLMVKQQLFRDPTLTKESWNDYLPNFGKKNKGHYDKIIIKKIDENAGRLDLLKEMPLSPGIHYNTKKLL